MANRIAAAWDKRVKIAQVADPKMAEAIAGEAGEAFRKLFFMGAMACYQEFAATQSDEDLTAVINEITAEIEAMLRANGIDPVKGRPLPG